MLMIPEITVLFLVLPIVKVELKTKEDPYI
jgi:hypothetical protein